MNVFCSEFDVYFEDISATGKIHLEKIAEWMSMTREAYFKKTCPEHLKFVESPIKMFTTDISITLIGTSKWADKITAVLTTENIKRISFEMHIQYVNQRTEQTIATTTQKVAFVNSSTKTFADIPCDMRQVIINYLK